MTRSSFMPFHTSMRTSCVVLEVLRFRETGWLVGLQGAQRVDAPTITPLLLHWQTVHAVLPSPLPFLCLCGTLQIAKAPTHLPTHPPTHLPKHLPTPTSPSYSPTYLTTHLATEPPTPLHRFVPYDAASPNSKLQAEMRRLADQDTAGWLLTEMAENRDKLRVSACKPRPAPAGLLAAPHL